LGVEKTVVEGELPGAETHGGHEHGQTGTGCGGHTCSCGDVDSTGYPELDARMIPHAVRHATVLGALEALDMGAGMVLIAAHDLPLLAQIEQRFPNDFTVEYLEPGAEAWRIAFVRGALV
jgi:uncharacterized protein (DUF2249 family)